MSRDIWADPGTETCLKSCSKASRKIRFGHPGTSTTLRCLMGWLDEFTPRRVTAKDSLFEENEFRAGLYLRSGLLQRCNDTQCVHPHPVAEPRRVFPGAFHGLTGLFSHLKEKTDIVSTPGL